MDSVILFITLVTHMVVLIALFMLGVWYVKSYKGSLDRIAQHTFLATKAIEQSSKALLVEKDMRESVASFAKDARALSGKAESHEAVLRILYLLIRDASDTDLAQEEIAKRMSDRLKRLSVYFNDKQTPKAAVKQQKNEKA